MYVKRYLYACTHMVCCINHLEAYGSARLKYAVQQEQERFYINRADEDNAHPQVIFSIITNFTVQGA